MSFEELDLHPKILKAVVEAGYEVPSPVQLKVIPKVHEGVDIRASAQTGTGKTAAFLLPALHRLASSPTKDGKGPRLLILVPTRELALQIETQARKYSQFLPGVKTVSVIGGVPYPKQMRQLSRPYDILIATPGRLIDYMNRKKVNLSHIEMLVLDEADRMLDMGFSEPVEEIVKATPSSRQTLLFSATLQGRVIKLSERLMNQPMEIKIHSSKEKHQNISQKLHYVDNLNHKNRLLDHILSGESVDHAIVFTSTKRQADRLATEMKEKGHSTAALHGDISQRQRTRTIMRLRDGKVKILVATDVAARGIDIDSVAHVINYDLPFSAEDYVHRIGRTGRAGAKGTALSFVAGKETAMVKKIEKYTGQSIAVMEIEGFEARAKTQKAPIKKRPFQPKSRRSNRRFR